ncbi:MAG TPA: T9SS type A sorting domain-containing protein [Bacteroidia bacterium]|nr:T9SS type A sorting domain-containing protein [Bacteroidia bacterium]
MFRTYCCSFLLLLLISALPVGAQQWEWVNRAGSSNVNNPGNDYSYVTRCDNAGNVYTLYWFSYGGDTIDTFFSGDQPVNPYISGQTWVAKYAPDGHKIWSKNLVSFVDTLTMYVDYFKPYCMEIDSFGHIYIGGQMDVDYMLFGSDTISNVNDPKTGFVISCDTALNHEWIFCTRTVTASAGGCTVYDLEFDDSGHIYAAGSVAGTTIFQNDTLTEPANAATNFLTRLDSNGQVNWVTSYHSGISMQEPHFTLDGSGMIYIGTNFIGNMYYGSDSVAMVSSNAAVLKLDTNLNFIAWFPIAQTYIEGIDVQDSALFFCGKFYGTITLPVGSFTANAHDGFVAKLLIDGSYQWYTPLDIPSSNVFDDLALTLDGSVFVVGDFSQPFTWNTFQFSPQSNHDDIIVVKIDSTGVIKWIATGGCVGADASNTIATDANDHVYISGRTGNSNNIFGSLSVTTLAGGDAITARINSFPCMGGIATIFPSADTTMCRNDSLQFTAMPGLMNFHWTNGDTASSAWMLSQGNISYYAIDSNGCYFQSNAVYVDVKPDVDIHGNTSGVCPGDTAAITPFDGPYSSYLWSDGTTNDTGFITQNGYYWLIATDSNGCVGLSDTIQMIYSEVHAVFYDSLLCAGSPTYFFDSSYCTTPGEYVNWWRWDFYPGSSLIQNPSNTYGSAGQYTVQLRVRSNEYCYDTLVTIINIEAVPFVSITMSGDTLFSSRPIGNQWFLDSLLIPGATDSFFVVLQNGSYMVTATNNCGSASSNIILIDVGIYETANGSIHCYPNPAHTGINISSADSHDPVTHLRLYDVHGKLVQEKQISGAELSTGYFLKFEFTEAGVYFLQVEDAWIRIVRTM